MNKEIHECYLCHKPCGSPKGEKSGPKIRLQLRIINAALGSKPMCQYCRGLMTRMKKKVRV